MKTQAPRIDRQGPVAQQDRLAVATLVGCAICAALVWVAVPAASRANDATPKATVAPPSKQEASAATKTSAPKQEASTATPESNQEASTPTAAPPSKQEAAAATVAPAASRQTSATTVAPTPKQEAAAATAAPSTSKSDSKSGSSPTPSDSTRSLKAGQDGTVLRSLTIEGEDRVAIHFERPELALNIDPSKAPGLSWGSPKDVLTRAELDFTTPLLTTSAAQPCPYLGRPWLATLSNGTVARFRPQVEGVARWTLLVADSRGATVAKFEGNGKPPSEIAWNGACMDGSAALPGLTYSYAFEAYDRAGNKRTFMGNGFEIPPYRLVSAKSDAILLPGPGVLSSSGDGLASAGLAAKTDSGLASPLVLETASCINQKPSAVTPVVVTAYARTFDRARSLADVVSQALRQEVLGDPSRIQVVTQVQPDAPADGAVRIGL